MHDLQSDHVKLPLLVSEVASMYVFFCTMTNTVSGDSPV